MLRLSASHIHALRISSTKKRLVWVDIGGGTGTYICFFIPSKYSLCVTGHNIELMDKYFPISSFDAVYLIDLCEPLLQVARKRFAAKGWKNVTVLCQDASQFSIPEWSHSKDSKESVSLVTLSYSLSMVRDYDLYTGHGFTPKLRSPITTLCWIELTTYFPPKMGYWGWSIFTPLENSPLSMKRRSVALAKNVDGLHVGFGKSGLTLIM